MTTGSHSPKAESVMDPQAQRLSRVYAEALADSLGEAGNLTAVVQELEGVVAVLREVPGSGELLAGALLSRRDRQAFVDRVFGSRVSPAVGSLLGVMARNGRLGLLGSVVCGLQDIVDRRAGRVEVEIRSAVPLDSSQLQQLREMLAGAFDTTPILRTAVDADLLGGIVVQVGDRVYDASVAGQLKDMAEKIGRSRLADT